ncbi:hypothetical protein D7I39_16705 [Allopusillimonas ginsengisoli]|nr:hypothetical protein D7I39_16705 [Allopusillimonas ginsengisoli]
MVAGTVFLIIHYLIFAPALESVGLYYSLGPWIWGLDNSSAVYLLLLLVVIYFFWRTRSPTLARGKLYLFRQLIENLLLAKRYDELVLLVEPQLPKLIKLSQHQPFLARLADRFTPRAQSNTATRLSGGQPKTKTAWKRGLGVRLQSVKAWSLGNDQASEQASALILDLITSSSLVAHLAVAHPYFCLKFVGTPEEIRSDFIEQYMDALLTESSSRLYMELKNNQNLREGNRLAIPQYNRLLRYFFADASVATSNGLYRAIGEAVCRRLDEDDKLAERLNRPLGGYHDVDRFRCPINSGITLFEIMLHEGIHQGLQDHMWLHYFRHFAKKILDRMCASTDKDSYLEWPTPFHYLLYRLVSISTDWAEQCSRINDAEIPEETRNAEGFDQHFISKEAIEALGSMLEDILPSPRISDSFKKYLLEIAIRSYVKIQSDHNLADVASFFLRAVIRGSALQTSTSYRQSLLDIFERLDHRLRGDAQQFGEALSASLVVGQDPLR